MRETHLRMISAFGLALFGLALFGTAAVPATTVEPGPKWIEQQKLLASDGAGIDHFGLTLAITENSAMISSIYDDSNRGAVYFFEREADGLWTETQKIIAPNGDPDDLFGIGIDLYGTTALIGADKDSTYEQEAGSAYFFERGPGGEWEFVQQVFSADPEADANFGSPVRLIQDQAFISSSQSEQATGAVYVFSRDELGVWQVNQKLRASDASPGDSFGFDVAVHGDLAAIGARYDFAGSVYLFERGSDGLWAETQKLTPSDGASGAWFGSEIELDDRQILIGSPERDGGAGLDTGAIYVFERDAEGLWQEGQLIEVSDPELFDHFGGVAHLANGRLIVGMTDSDEFGTNSGAAYIFDRDPEGTWTETQKLLPSSGESLDEFGSAVGMTAREAIIGAHRDDEIASAAGAAYTFSLEGCELQLDLARPIVEPGDLLSGELSIKHRRHETVIVPVRLWIEDERGALLASFRTRDLEFRYGDTLSQPISLQIPSNTRPGDYRLMVGLEGMMQGAAWTSQNVTVVDASSN